MENFEFKKNNVDAESEKELSEITQEFYESGLNIIDFIVKKFDEKEKEESQKKSDDLYKMSMDFKEMDGIFANPCKNQNRFTDNVVLVNIEDLIDEFKEGKLFN